MVREELAAVAEQAAKGDGLNTAVAPPVVAEDSVSLNEDPSQRKKEQAETNLTSFIAKLQGAMKSGQWTGIGEEDTNLVLRSIRVLKGQAISAARNPDARSGAAVKGAATRKQRDADMQKFIKKSRAQDEARIEALKKRMKSGLLPQFVINMGASEPDSTFYKPIGPEVLGHDGFSVPKFELRRAYLNTKVTAAEMKRIVGDGNRPVPPPL